MSRPLLLDLFCCAGGAGVGYRRAGFDVVGVDRAKQPRYPFAFHRGDALAVLADLARQVAAGQVPTFAGRPVAATHGSPPCQRYCDLARQNKREYPDLVAPTRDLMRAVGLPWVIENVPEAPLLDPIVLCGTMFPGLRVIRHRGFESSVPLVAPPHPPGPHPLCYTLDKRKPHYGRLDEWTAFVTVTGGGNCSKAAASDAMGIDWMIVKGELNEAIPPAYTEYVGKQLMESL